jgi:hypothetical protein
VLHCGKTCILYDAIAEENHSAQKTKIGHEHQHAKIEAQNYEVCNFFIKFLGHRLPGISEFNRVASNNAQ